MMATGHCVSAALAGVGTAQVLGVVPVDPTFWAWTGVMVGAALLPDFDTRSATVNNLWGPVTNGVRVFKIPILPGLWPILRPLVGGHRRGSHSALGLIVLLAALWLCSHWLLSSAIVAALAFGLALRGTGVLTEYLIGLKYRRRYWVGNLAASAAAGWYLFDHALRLPGWVPWAMAGGALVHVMGDMLTDSGVKLAWPTRDVDVRLLPEPLCFKAGGWVENTLVVPPMLIAAVLVVAYQAGYDPIGAVFEAMRSA